MKSSGASVGSALHGRGINTTLASIAYADSSADPMPVIRKMAAAGASLDEIGARTGLTGSQVRYRIKKNGMVWNRKVGRPPSHD